MKYLGIDIGTSFIKSGIFDFNNLSITDVKRAPNTLIIKNKNSLVKEYDINKIYNKVLSIIKYYINEGHDYEGLILSTQMHGFVILDKKGNNITNYVSWQDERAIEFINKNQTYIDRINELIETEEIIKTGMGLKPGYAICSLFHMRVNNILPKEEKLFFCTLGDYINSKLTGINKYYCHATNAASTGLFNIEENKWNQRIIECLGLSNILFPEIEAENIIGECCINNRKIKLHPSIGDHQASVLGTGILPKKEISINIGTGSQISLIDKEIEYGEYQIRPFFDSYFIKTIPNIPAGRALNVIFNLIKDVGYRVYDIGKIESEKLWKIIDKKIESYKETDLEVSISLFKSSLNKSTGEITNIKENNFKIEDLFLGAYINMVDNYYDLLKKLIPQHTNIQKIVLSGGLPRKSPIILDLISEKFMINTVLSNYSEEALAGLFCIVLSYYKGISIIDTYKYCRKLK